MSLAVPYLEFPSNDGSLIGLSWHQRGSDYISLPVSLVYIFSFQLLIQTLTPTYTRTSSKIWLANCLTKRNLIGPTCSH